MDNLAQLAKLIKRRNSLEREITALTNRPAALGHLGEYIASIIFHITLEESASHKSIDGRFSEGLLKGCTVNVKWYARREGVLDITPIALPDYFLVLTGPKSSAISSRGQARPWIIENVFLFEAQTLINELKLSNLKIGISTSLRKHLWAKAEIYPVHSNNALDLSREQHETLALFSSEAVG